MLSPGQLVNVESWTTDKIICFHVFFFSFFFFNIVLSHSINWIEWPFGTLWNWLHFLRFCGFNYHIFFYIESIAITLALAWQYLIIGSNNTVGSSVYSMSLLTCVSPWVYAFLTRTSSQVQEHYAIYPDQIQSLSGLQNVNHFCFDDGNCVLEC